MHSDFHSWVDIYQENIFTEVAQITAYMIPQKAEMIPWQKHTLGDGSEAWSKQWKLDWSLSLVLWLLFPECDWKTYNYVYYDKFMKAYLGEKHPPELVSSFILSG